MKVSAKGHYTRQLKVSDTTENFLRNIEKEGEDANLLASVLLEMATQMLRHGHIQMLNNTLLCQTDKGKVEVKLAPPNRGKTPYDA